MVLNCNCTHGTKSIPGFFFTLKKGSGNKGYGANTSVRYPASNNVFNLKEVAAECEVGVQTAQTWKLWWFVLY